MSYQTHEPAHFATHTHTRDPIHLSLSAGVQVSKTTPPPEERQSTFDGEKKRFQGTYQDIFIEA